MSNPLFQAGYGMPQNNMTSMVQKLNQFRQFLQGDPRQQVQQLLNSGRVTQQQYNQAVQTAQQIQRMMGGK